MSAEAVLTILKKYRDRYVSGEDISAKLKVSRAAVWKEIHGLRQLGYQIEAYPHLGYQLTGIPDKLFADEIGYELATRTIGRKIVSYDTLDSTNDVVRKFGQDRLEEGICVFAESQRKGRGRLGRSWLSPKGKGILVSFLLRPSISLGQISGMTLMVAVSVVKAVLKQTGVQLGIKWPNDMIYQDRKAGGILTELGAEADRLDFAVVGLGLNVNGSASDLPKDSIALGEIAGKELSRVALAQAILEQLDRDYAKFKKGPADDLAAEWERYSATTGRRVVAHLMNHKISGQATGIDRDGALWIRKDNGLQERVLSGDIQHLR